MQIAVKVITMTTLIKYYYVHTDTRFSVNIIFTELNALVDLLSFLYVMYISGISSLSLAHPVSVVAMHAHA